MDIRKDGDWLSIHFDNNNVKEIKYDSNGLCYIFSPSGDLISKFQTVASPAFNHQYGTHISKDGKYLFIGSWEKGLYCYDINTGKIIWKKTPGRVRHIFVQDDYLVIEMGGRGIYKRDIKNGEIMTEIKMSNIDCIFQIDENEIFAGIGRNKYYIYQLPDLFVKKEIKVSELNINHCTSFRIRKCNKENDTLQVVGWERCPNGDRSKDGLVNITREISI